jgi:hypothetical protein
MSPSATCNQSTTCRGPEENILSTNSLNLAVASDGISSMPGSDTNGFSCKRARFLAFIVSGTGVRRSIQKTPMCHTNTQACHTDTSPASLLKNSGWDVPAVKAHKLLPPWSAWVGVRSVYNQNTHYEKEICGVESRKLLGGPVELEHGLAPDK